MSFSELEELLKQELGASSFRAAQLFQWVYRHRVCQPAQMTNIRKEMRLKLAELLRFPLFQSVSRQVSKDGSRKYLFKLDDGHMIEAVMIKQPSRMTLCVSSQVGCGFACQFCQTGTMGFIRNLKAAEIIQQVLAVKSDALNFGDDFTNIVFMGMGEPLHNIKNVLKAISIMNNDHGLSISARKITVSTVGLVPAIKKFAESGTEANLAVSLNATTNSVRDKLMPINRRFPIEVLVETLKEMPLKPRKRITIEYVMLASVNDSVEDLRRLCTLLKPVSCKVNLIPYNMNTGLGMDGVQFRAPSQAVIDNWQQELNRHGFVATVRWSKGLDIDAACGQLATKGKGQLAAKKGGHLFSNSQTGKELRVAQEAADTAQPAC